MCNFFLFVSFIASVQVRIFPLNIRDIIIYFARWWEKYLSKRSLIKHTCSWRDKLIVLWTLNRRAKIFLRISVIVLIFHHMLWVINKIMQAASISLVFTLLSGLVLIKIYVSNNHYVKNIRIRRFSCRYFPHSYWRKIRIRRTPNTDTFYAVNGREAAIKGSVYHFWLLHAPIISARINYHEK